MNRVGAALKWIILLPILVVVTLLAVANDQPVTVRLNPFDSSDTSLSIDLALYQLGFLIFILGVLVGGFVAWNKQRRFRRLAKVEHREAVHWREKAESTNPPKMGNASMLAPPKHHNS